MKHRFVPTLMAGALLLSLAFVASAPTASAAGCTVNLGICHDNGNCLVNAGTCGDARVEEPSCRYYEYGVCERWA